MTPPTSPKPGPESTLDEVRESLIQAGVDRLVAVGMAPGLDRLTLRDVIADADVSRATAYRSLSDPDLDPQGRLRIDVLNRIIGRSTRHLRLDATIDAASAELTRNAALLQSPDVAERTRALRNVIRVAANANYHEVAESNERALLIAMFGALRTLPEDETVEQREMQRAGEADLTRLFSDFYTSFAEAFGYVLKPRYRVEHFVTAVVSLLEGLTMRIDTSDELVGVDRSTGPAGSTESWTLFAMGFEALFAQFWEPENAKDPIADLSRY